MASSSIFAVSRSTASPARYASTAMSRPTIADYLLPTVTEVPDLTVLHIECKSPFTPLGSKGVGEGNCMSTPVCLANAVADALGVQSLDLPLTPAKLSAILSAAD